MPLAGAEVVRDADVVFDRVASLAARLDMPGGVEAGEDSEPEGNVGVGSTLLAAELGVKLELVEVVGEDRFEVGDKDVGETVFRGQKSVKACEIADGVGMTE